MLQIQYTFAMKGIRPRARNDAVASLLLSVPEILLVLEGGIRSGIISSPPLGNFHDPGSHPRVLTRVPLRLSNPSRNVRRHIPPPANKITALRRDFVLAEREGFEPSIPCEYAGFRNRCFRPLSHLSFGPIVMLPLLRAASISARQKRT